MVVKPHSDWMLGLNFMVGPFEVFGTPKACDPHALFDQLAVFLV